METRALTPSKPSRVTRPPKRPRALARAAGTKEARALARATGAERPRRLAAAGSVGVCGIAERTRPRGDWGRLGHHSLGARRCNLGARRSRWRALHGWRHQAPRGRGDRHRRRSHRTLARRGPLPRGRLDRASPHSRAAGLVPLVAMRRVGRGLGCRRRRTSGTARSRQGRTGKRSRRLRDDAIFDRGLLHVGRPGALRLGAASRRSGATGAARHRADLDGPRAAQRISRSDLAEVRGRRRDRVGILEHLVGKT